ncbi:unnamed protein product [Lactuca virosa]|uniref:Uncharacterized protein n=1 Tax=Lactuca virosa TaxID=75947 RepID=A0AAU9PU63_9ASTR|nr:unnamed protein product [Lactuca virosa]
MKADEVNKDIKKGFNSWGNGKKNKNNREGLQGQNGNSTTENAFYYSTADCRASSSPVASQANSYAAPGPVATLPTAAATVQVSAAVPIVAAEESHTTPDVSPNLTAAPVVNSENPSTHNANSGSLKNGIDHGASPVC